MKISEYIGSMNEIVSRLNPNHHSSNVKIHSGTYKAVATTFGLIYIQPNKRVIAKYSDIEICTTFDKNGNAENIDFSLSFCQDIPGSVNSHITVYPDCFDYDDTDILDRYIEQLEKLKDSVKQFPGVYENEAYTSINLQFKGKRMQNIRNPTANDKTTRGVEIEQPNVEVTIKYNMTLPIGAIDPKITEIIDAIMEAGFRTSEIIGQMFPEIYTTG